MKIFTLLSCLLLVLLHLNLASAACTVSQDFTDAIDAAVQDLITDSAFKTK